MEGIGVFIPLGLVIDNAGSSFGKALKENFGRRQHLGAVRPGQDRKVELPALDEPFGKAAAAEQRQPLLHCAHSNVSVESACRRAAASRPMEACSQVDLMIQVPAYVLRGASKVPPCPCPDRGQARPGSAARPCCSISLAARLVGGLRRPRPASRCRAEPWRRAETERDG